MAGQPVTYGSHGGSCRPEQRHRADRRRLRGGRVHPHRSHQHPRIRFDHRDREQPVRGHPQPVEPGPHPGWLERGCWLVGGGRHVPGGPRQRRRWFHQDPRIVLRAGRPQAEPGPGVVDGARVAGHGHRGCTRPHRGRRRRRPRCHQRPRPLRLVRCATARPSVRRRGGRRSRTAPGGPVHGVGAGCAGGRRAGRRGGAGRPAPGGGRPPRVETRCRRVRPVGTDPLPQCDQRRAERDGGHRLGPGRAPQPGRP